MLARVPDKLSMKARQLLHSTTVVLLGQANAFGEMMKKLAFLVFGAVLFVGSPVSAQTFTPVDAATAPQDGGELYYRGYVGGATFNNYVAGPYWGSYSATGPAFSIYCVDFHNTVNPQGDPWFYNATSLGSSDMSQTRLGAGSLTTYRQTAFLSSLFAATDKTVWGPIHGGIWSLTSATTLPGEDGVFGTGDVTDLDYWADLASQPGIPELDWGNWYVLTPTTSPTGAFDNSQEFLVHVTTPEPATAMLMVSGLFLIGVAARRRNREEDTV